ncbi:MAG TPA: DEAD/DEAH box helicase [Thermoanaerobaculia bacterium]|jgi:ATP-dependent RNA helicase DeaD
MSESPNPFSALGLRDAVVENLTRLGYEAPTPIQERTIPLLLGGRDLIGQAQTGTGKTAAFALPILEKIDPKERATQALVLTPTRELAMQVAEAIHSYAQGLGPIHVIPLYGGAPIVPQLKRLERGAQVVVGTPGRLIDHLDRKSLDLSHIRLLVLDEADEMLKMGFAEDVDKILAASPEGRQTALFSATMPEEVLRIARRHLHDAERIEIEHRSLSAPAIEQRFLNVSEGQKLEVLTQILELEPAEAVLIFRRTKTGSAELAEKLEARGFAAVAMHGDMTQPLRESVIRRLRAGQVEIVVATDVAARGLDVEQITHVINYDIPYDVEAYVHRIGRTGRAGRAGLATLFITPRERRMMREIERYTGAPIKPMRIPTRADIAAKRTAVFKDNVRKTIQEGDLELYVELVEQLAEEGPFDMAEIAAAAARLANSARSIVAPREDAPAAMAAAPASSTASSSSPSAPREEREPMHEKTVRMAMSVGKRDGIRPADVVGSIANEADIPGRDIGPIEIRDDITYVGIPERFVDVVLEKVGRAKFRGRAVNLRVAPRELADVKPRAPKPAPRFDDRRPPRFEQRDDRPPQREQRFPRRDDRPPARGARDDRPLSRGPRDDRPPSRGPRDDRPPSRGARDAGPPRRDTRFGDRPARPFRDDRGPQRDSRSPRGPNPFYSGAHKPKKRPK